MSIQRRWVTPLVFILLMSVTFSLSLGPIAPKVTGAVLYNSGNPTAEEQLVLEYVNRARADPIAEGQRLGIDIHEGLSNPSLVGPRPPLAMNNMLLSIAEAHSRDMYTQNYFSHTDPNGTTPFDRIINAGYDYVRAGENMAASTDASATELEDLMMIDSGNAGRPHRVNLLDLITSYPCSNAPCVYYEVGIGYYAGTNPNSIGLADLITEDFGATGNTGPFLLGVVYDDMNHNNFYDIGEGIAGVTITTSAGGYYAVSSSSGGYAIPIGTSGTVTVTASGPGFGPITKTVTLTGVNVKVDFTSTVQASTTSTSAQTSITSSITSTHLTTSSSQTTTSIVNNPSIALIPSSASAGLTVYVSGSGFLTGDTGCSFSGNPVGASTCAISNGILTGSFVVASVGAGSYPVTAMGSPGSDSVSTSLTIIGSALTLNPSSASAGSTVSVSGSGFSPTDTSCTLSSGSITSYTCSISGGALTGTFVVSTAGAGVYGVIATGSPAGDSATVNFQITAPTPSITVNPSGAQAGATVTVSGSGFASTDSTCTIAGSSGSSSSPFCTISGGTVTGSFVVANVTAAVYAVKVTGGQVGDSAIAAFAVNPSLNQATVTSSSTVPTSTSLSTVATQSTSVVSTSNAVTSALTNTPSTTVTTSPTSTLTFGSVPEAMPPIPGFTLESIVIGMILGLALAMAKRRKTHR